ncbi:hypothetical protein [Thorsellia kenyensis]|uniref:Tetratricopeptide repeat protein n=1 Tax=Thorsellia kenyensis TaxID=1549888 RepID=A0ABV6C785_9GAMM
MTSIDILTGSALHSWLDAQWDFFSHPKETIDEAQRILLLKRSLEETRCEPDDYPSLNKYFRLWYVINEFDMALNVIETYTNSILNNVNNNDKIYISIQISLWKLSIYTKIKHENFLIQCDVLVEELFASPDKGAVLEDWSTFLNIVESAKQWNKYRELLRKRIAFEPRFAKENVNYLEGLLWIYSRDCFAFICDNQKEEAENSVKRLIETLQEDKFKDKVTTKTWLEQANFLVSLMPECIDEMIFHIKALVQDDWPDAIKKELNIKIAQIKAEQKYAQNQLEEAIEFGLAGHYEIARQGHHFTTKLMDWIIELGNYDKAAKIALDAIRFNLKDASNHAISLAYKHHEMNPSLYWHLIICWYNCFALYNKNRHSDYILTEEEQKIATHLLNEHLAKAKSIDASHVDIQSFEIYLLIQNKAQINEDEYHQKVLTLCERFFRDPNNYRSKEHISAYYRAKAHLLGIKTALESEFMPASEAFENFDLSQSLFVREEEWQKYSDHYESILTLKHKFEICGFEQYQRFYETGIGYYRDGNIHNFSMLIRNICCELSECDKKTPEEIKGRAQKILELSHLAIKVSPFAEHYSGIFDAYNLLQDFEKMVEAAENLWQIANTHGYSRYTPQNILDFFVPYLGQQGRFRELMIWLERLDQWYAYLSEDQQVAQQESYFSQIIHILSQVASQQPEETSIKLEKALTHNPPFWETNGRTALNISSIYFQLHNYDKAIEFGKLALALTTEYDTAEVIKKAERNLTIMQDTLANQNKTILKPWWKFW